MELFYIIVGLALWIGGPVCAYADAMTLKKQGVPISPGAVVAVLGLIPILYSLVSYSFLDPYTNTGRLLTSLNFLMLVVALALAGYILYRQKLVKNYNPKMTLEKGVRGY
jgi:hypothetical protein